MTPNELLEILGAKGIRLSPRIRFEAPEGALSPDLRAALAEHKDEVLVRLLIGDDAGTAAMRHLHDLYRAACFELAETLGWPRLPLDPPVTIVGGEAMWRLFLTKASVPELRECALPRLRAMLDRIPPPDGDEKPTCTRA